jgi:hypothetical protein
MSGGHDEDYIYSLTLFGNLTDLTYPLGVATNAGTNISTIQHYRNSYNNISTIQHYENTFNNISTIQHFENAYNQLLQQRLAPVSWDDSRNKEDETQGNEILVASLSEDDILTNTNLQTDTLFKKLKQEFKEGSRFAELYTDQLKEVQDSIVKIELGIQNLKRNCEIHFQDGIEGLHKQYNEFQKEINFCKQKTIEEIKKKLNAKNLEVESISKKLNILRKIIVSGVQEIVKPEDIQKKMCPICFENEVNTVLVPCGHTYCKSCSESDRSRHAKCPQCRVQINARVKLYFTA